MKGNFYTRIIQEYREKHPETSALLFDTDILRAHFSDGRLTEREPKPFSVYKRA